MRKTALILGLLSLSLPVWLSQPAVAGDKCELKYREKYDKKSGRYKYKHKKKCRGYKYKRNRRSHDGDPPPWAPAYGYRTKYPDIDIGTCNRGFSNSQLVGGALGAVVGGLLGSKVGKGDGKLAATAAGTLLGALAGASIAQSMDTADNECVRKTLEGSLDQRQVAWQNPDADAQYKVTPVKSYKNTAGRYCREYITEAVIGGVTEKVYGTACRQPDGAWELMS
jgi:surface antigen